MGVPACLWRRTGEIYKGNKEFAELVGVAPELLRDGKLAIYELMSEESAVNYWEKVRLCERRTCSCLNAVYLVRFDSVQQWAKGSSDKLCVDQRTFLLISSKSS
jgi:hypothetical protein